MITLTNARILTMDEGLSEYANGWIRIEDDRILALGEGAPPDSDGEIIDMGGDLVMPGMVNPHCHMAMTLFRGLGEDVDDRLFRYILPLERECITARTVEIGSRLAALEMIRGGVTAVADMYYFEDKVGAVIDESGIRGVIGQTLGDFDAPDHKTFDEAFGLSDALAERFAGHDRITASIAPHAPYSTGLEVMARVAEWSNAHDLPVQLHMAETVPETEWAHKNHQMSPVKVVHKAGLLKPGLIAAHCLFVDEQDMELMAEGQIGVAHNARANAKAGRGIAPVDAMRKNGITVGISTDGPMSGNTLDLFAQFGPVTMFQKLLGGSRKPMPAADVVTMATRDGAKVLGLGDRIGTLEPGKQADLIRVSLKDPRLHPIYDIYSALVFATFATDVQDVMVAGQWLMRDRKVATLEQDKVMADALQVAGEFNARIAEIDRTKQ